jgi:RNA polymerase sigma factor (sigma-70 family)
MARKSLSDDSGSAATSAACLRERMSDSLDQIYETYEPMVERWARRLAGPGAEVEDLVHDVFLVALRRMHEFRGDAKISTWLFRITELIVRKRRVSAGVFTVSSVSRFATTRPRWRRAARRRSKNWSAVSSARRCTRPWIACPKNTARPSSCSTLTAVQRRKWRACWESRPTPSG